MSRERSVFSERSADSTVCCTSFTPYDFTRQPRKSWFVTDGGPESAATSHAGTSSDLPTHSHALALDDQPMADMSSSRSAVDVRQLNQSGPGASPLPRQQSDNRATPSQSSLSIQTDGGIGTGTGASGGEMFEMVEQRRNHNDIGRSGLSEQHDAPS